MSVSFTKHVTVKMKSLLSNISLRGNISLRYGELQELYHLDTHKSMGTDGISSRVPKELVE